jgi:hypothetical protein
MRYPTGGVNHHRQCCALEAIEQAARPRRTQMLSSRLAHADEEERDMIPAPSPVQLTDAELDELGNAMAARITQLRGSALHRLRIKGKATLLKAI